MIDFDALNRDLLTKARELIPTWIPGGRWRGHEYVAASIEGGEGSSFSVNAQTGLFADFAGGPRGADLIDLYALRFGFDNLREAALALGATDKPNGMNGAYAHTDAPVPRETEASASENTGAATPSPLQPPTSAGTLPLPPPDIDWKPQDFKHSHHGLPSKFWLYRDIQGAVLYCVARYERDAGKQIIPWTWSGTQWVARAAPRPRALYNLPALAALDGPALIVEGEKTCDAAQGYFPANPCLTWSGGAMAVRHADWTPLAGRACILWPDNDQPGRDAIAKLAEILFKQGCTLQIITAEHKPTGWDLADAEPEDDIPTYAESHIRDMPGPLPQPKPPKPRRSKPLSLPATAPLQTTPPASATVIDAAPADDAAGSVSLYETYARYAFHRKSNGRPYCNEHNVGAAIRYRNAQPDPIDLYFDDFSERVMVGPDELTDGIVLDIMGWLQNHLEMFDIGPKTVRDGIVLYARQHRRNPLKDWLTALTWDHIPRLEDLLPIGFGTLNNDYFAAVGRCFITGMVARVMRPGCKADCMPVFEGPEGGRKSSALAAIGGDYFAEIHDSILSKDFYISMSGKWLCEISELHAFKTADVERIKGIISNPVDRYRAPYGSVATDHPRQGVFSGTTNRDDWNNSDTGARRFWPVTVGKIDLTWIRENREQIFAEAMHRYGQGEPWWDVPEESANDERDARYESDAWEDILSEYLKHNTIVRLPYLMESMLDMKPADFDMASQRRVARILRRYGFARRVVRDGQTTRREWAKKIR